MKKYIRTENGVYELVDDAHIIKNNKLYEKEYFNNPFGDGNAEYIGEILIDEILAEADTPEELCDEFVIKHIASSKPYVADGYQKTQILKDRQKAFLYGVEEVKGAIYTDKGLIYVAKMNENGDMVLI